MRRKITAIVCSFAVLVACVLLVGCGGGNGDSGVGTVSSDSKYIGTWEGVKASFADEETTVEEVIKGPFIMELKADGTADVTMGQEEKMTANWGETKEGIKVKGDDINLDFEDKDGVLETSVIGMHFYLEKK